MLKDLSRNFDKANAIVAAAICLFILGVYAHTAAPTVSFWDCGEFIATSAILGVPHPPGAPLYTLVGRIFSIIPFYEDIAARINFVSALCSSLAALFGYLSAVRLLRLWFGADNSVLSRTLIYAGAVCGALLLAFGRTEWSNSVEAEVYALSMLIFFAVLWLALIYRELQNTYTGDRVLLVAVFLTFLGIGVHMTTFLIMPAAAIMLMIKKNTPAKVWYIVAAFFAFELYLIFALSKHSFDTPYYVPLMIVLVAYIMYALSFDRLSRDILIIGVGLLIACAPVLSSISGVSSQVLSITSAVAMLGLFGFAIRMIILWLNARKSDRIVTHGEIAPALFVFAGLAMAGILLLNLYGFKPFLGLTIAAGIILAVLVWKFIDVPMLLAIGTASLIILGVKEYLWGSLIGAALIVLYGVIVKEGRWKTALLVLVVAFIGFSVHLSIPLRAAQNPSINENKPDNFKTLVNYLERKQYGSQSMVERMFERRGEWANQFGNFRRMGFWGFFSNQFGVLGSKFLSLFILGVFGIWEITRKRPESGAFICVLLLLCTAGLVLYMNFADGTRYEPNVNMDYTEVRDRDYFWTPGFMLFGLAIGIGATMLVQVIRESIQRFSEWPRRVILGASSVIFLIPVFAIAANYHENDRSRNYMAYDYAWNLLSAADPNAVLFTAGDNDTFPLWALQEAFGIRKDVRVVNLSLGNTDWYIRQVRDHMGIKLTWTDEETRALRAFRTTDGRTMNIQDQLVDQVLDNNMGSMPINYSATCGTDERQYNGRNIDSILTFSRFMFRLKTDPSQPSFDLDGTLKYISDTGTFRTRGWGDLSIYRDEAAIRTMGNMAGSFTLVSDSLRKAGKGTEAEQVLKTAQGIFPYDGGVAEQIALNYMDKNDTLSITNLLIRSRTPNRNRLTVILSRTFRKCDNRAGAIRILDSLLAAEPTYRGTFDELMRIYVEAKDVENIKSAMSRWLATNPTDDPVSKAYQQLLSGWSPFTDSAMMKR